MVEENGILTGANRSTGRKTCPSAILIWISIERMAGFCEYGNILNCSFMVPTNAPLILYICKGKVLPRTGYEGEQMYSSALPSTSALDLGG